MLTRNRVVFIVGLLLVLLATLAFFVGGAPLAAAAAPTPAKGATPGKEPKPTSVPVDHGKGNHGDTALPGPLLGTVKDYRPGSSITVDLNAKDATALTLIIDKNTQIVPQVGGNRKVAVSIQLGDRVQIISRPVRDGRTAMAQVIVVEAPVGSRTQKSGDPAEAPGARDDADGVELPTPAVILIATVTPSLSPTSIATAIPTPLPTLPATGVPNRTPTTIPVPSPTPTPVGTPARATRTPISRP